MQNSKSGGVFEQLKNSLEGLKKMLTMNPLKKKYVIKKAACPMAKEKFE